VLAARRKFMVERKEFIVATPNVRVDSW